MPIEFRGGEVMQTGICLDVGMLERRRLSLGMSRRELATRAKVSKSSIHRALTDGRAGLLVAKKLTDALALDLQDVFLPWLRRG